MSSLKDLASLIMIPSLVKDGRLDTVKPLGNSIIHPDATGNNDGTDGSTPAEGNFTFTRGSNLSATRVNASQLIEKGRENLLLQSNQFDTTWATNNSSVTSGQSGYDGLNNAWELKENTSTGVHEIIQTLSVSTGVQTYSLKVSANTRSKMALVLAGSAFNSGGNGVGIFNLTNGTLISSSGSLIDAKITSLGGNWYNVSITKLASSSSAVAVVQLVDDSNNTSYTGNGTGSIYIQDSQLEQGLVATSVIETGASTAQAGILENTPRLDYSGGASCPSLLLEPSRTNLIPQSEYFNSSYWIKSGSPTVSVSDNAGISPEGVSNATRFVAASAQQSTRLYTSVTWTAVPYTLSLYVKNNGGTNTNLRFSYYDSTGQYFSPTFTLTDEWQRIEYTFTPTASSGGFWIVNTPTGGLNLDLLAFAAQLEVGSYPTSYIPTYGVSQTRAQDVCVNAGDVNTFNSLEGVLYAEIKALSETGGNRYITLSDGTDTNRVVIRFQDTDKIGCYIGTSNGGAVDITKSSANISSGFLKVAVKWKVNDCALWINGIEIGTSVSFASFNTSTLDTLNLSGTDGSTLTLKANTNQVLVFPTALSDTELATLTTI